MLEEAEQAHTAALAALRAQQQDALAELKATHEQVIAELKAKHEHELVRHDAAATAAEKKAQQLEDSLTSVRRENVSLESVLQERTLELERVNAALAETRKDASHLRDVAEFRSNALTEVHAKLESEREARKIAESHETDSRAQLQRLEDRLERFTKQLAALEKSSASRDRRS